MIATPNRRWWLTATHLGLALVGFCVGRQFVPRVTDGGTLPPRLFSDTRAVHGATVIPGDRAGGTSNKPQAKGRWDKRTVDWERLIQLSQTGDSDEILAQLRALHREPDLSKQLLGGQLLIGRLADIAPLRALAEAAALSGRESRAMAEEVVMTRWAMRDPVAASDYLAENAASFGFLDAHQRSIAATVARAWAQSDPEAAAEWALSQPVELRGDALGAVVRNIAGYDPEAATEILNRLPEGFERTELIESMVASLAESNPDAMAAWSLALPGDSERTTATALAVESWSNQDPESAAQWVSALPKGPVRDAAIASLINGSSFLLSPETSAAWIQQIADDDQRTSAEQSLDLRWRTLDPESYTAIGPQTP